MKTQLHLAGWLVMILFAPTGLSQAQEPSKRFSIWDIHLGDAASAIPDEYVNYACGTNGGPPSRKLPNFAAFKTCKTGADGLHEIEHLVQAFCWVSVLVAGTNPGQTIRLAHGRDLPADGEGVQVNCGHFAAAAHRHEGARHPRHDEDAGRPAAQIQRSDRLVRSHVDHYEVGVIRLR